MSIDLGAILDAAAPTVEAAIRTSGTTISIWRDPDGKTSISFDPDTLEYTDSAPATQILGGQPALITVKVPRLRPDGPAQTENVLAYRVLLLPAVTNVRERDIIKVTKSRDRRLIGQRMRVQDVHADTPGVVRELDCIAMDEAEL